MKNYKTIAQSTNDGLNEILEIAAGLLDGAGQYIWERTEKPYVQNPTMTADSTISGAMHFTSADIDLSKATEPFFDGFAHSTGEYYFEYVDNALIYHRQGAAVPVTYDPARQAIIGTTGGGVFSYDGVKNADGKPNQYVVAKEHNKYPTSGETGYYFYKRQDKPSLAELGIDFGEILQASDEYTLVINHNLGVVPRDIFLISKILESRTGGVVCVHNSRMISENSLQSGLYNIGTKELQKDKNKIKFSGNGEFQSNKTYYWFALA